MTILNLYCFVYTLFFYRIHYNINPKIIELFVEQIVPSNLMIDLHRYDAGCYFLNSLKTVFTTD